MMDLSAYPKYTLIKADHPDCDKQQLFIKTSGKFWELVGMELFLTSEHLTNVTVISFPLPEDALYLAEVVSIQANESPHCEKCAVHLHRVSSLLRGVYSPEPEITLDI